MQITACICQWTKGERITGGCMQTLTDCRATSAAAMVAPSPTPFRMLPLDTFRALPPRGCGGASISNPPNALSQSSPSHELFFISLPIVSKLYYRNNLLFLPPRCSLPLQQHLQHVWVAPLIFIMLGSHPAHSSGNLKYHIFRL